MPLLNLLQFPHDVILESSRQSFHNSEALKKVFIGESIAAQLTWRRVERQLKNQEVTVQFSVRHMPRFLA